MYNTNQFSPFFNRQPYYVPNYQQMPQQAPVQQPSEMPITGIRFLMADQIKGFIPTLGTKAMLIDKENSIAYIVASDTLGNMYKQAYSFSAIKTEAPKQTKVEYATKEDIANIKKELENLRKPSVSTTTKENVQPKL